MDELGKKLNITNQDGWYKLRAKELIAFGGRGLLNLKYNGSIHKLLTVVYPEYLTT